MPRPTIPTRNLACSPKTTAVHCVILESSLDVFMQGLLALTSFLILVVKWWFERPRRPVKVAAMDGSKQGGGFAVARALARAPPLSPAAAIVPARCLLSALSRDRCAQTSSTCTCR